MDECHWHVQSWAHLNIYSIRVHHLPQYNNAYIDWWWLINSGHLVIDFSLYPPYLSSNSPHATFSSNQIGPFLQSLPNYIWIFFHSYLYLDNFSFRRLVSFIKTVYIAVNLWARTICFSFFRSIHIFLFFRVNLSHLDFPFTAVTEICSGWMLKNITYALKLSILFLRETKNEIKGVNGKMI